MCDNDVDLEAGIYVFMVDAIFNTEADKNEDFKRINIGIYASRKIQMNQMSYKDGVKAIASAFKQNAATASVDKRKLFKATEPYYGGKCYHVCDLCPTKAHYGYIYTKNPTQYALKEGITPKLVGSEVIYPFESHGPGGKEIINEIAPGEDAIILLRRIEDKTSFNITTHVYPRI